MAGQVEARSKGLADRDLPPRLQHARLYSAVGSWPCEVLLDWVYGLTGKANRV